MKHVYQPNDIVNAGGVLWRATATTRRQVPLLTKRGMPAQTNWVAVGRCASPNAGTSTGSPNPVSGPALQQNFILGPYKDITVSYDYNGNTFGTALTGSRQNLLDAVPNLPAMVWAFATGTCGQETWGGINADTMVAANLPLWVAAKKPYIISTGGAAGSFTCASDGGFSAFIDRYFSPYLVGIDFDIEAGQSAEDIAALVARVQAAQKNDKYKNLRFSFTLATLAGNVSESLGASGVTTLKAIADAGLKNYIINLMVMDYGSSSASNCILVGSNTCDMGASAVQAAKNLQTAYNVPYNQIALTPMIGGNDTQDEIFSAKDVATMMTFVRQQGLIGVHWWSLDRDVDCAADNTAASSVCSGKNNLGALGFLKAFLTASK